MTAHHAIAIEVTPAQLRELRYAANNEFGLNDPIGFTTGAEGCGWRKVMRGLLAKGLVQHSSRGGYEITQRGRDVVAADKRADAR